MAIDKSLPISNKGTKGSPVTDSGGNPVAGAEVTLWRRVLNDTNSDGEGDHVFDGLGGLSGDLTIYSDGAEITLSEP